MAAGLYGLPRRGLWLLLAHHLFMVTACQDAHYGTLIQELCLARFKEDMEAVGRPLWCDWGKTINPGMEDKVECQWPLGDFWSHFLSEGMNQELEIKRDVVKMTEQPVVQADQLSASTE